MGWTCALHVVSEFVDEDTQQSIGDDPPNSIGSVRSDMDSLDLEDVLTSVLRKKCVAFHRCPTWAGFSLGVSRQ